MTNSRKSSLIVLISLIVFSISLPTISLALPEVISLSTGEWAPYSSDKLDGGGCATVILTAVLKEMGFKPDVQFVPWSRARQRVLQNKVIASFPWFITDERKKKFIFSESFFTINSKFFFYKDSMKDVTWTNLAELKKYRIGGVQDFSYMEDFTKAGIKADMLTIEELGFKMLAADRIDLFPCAELVGLGIIKRIFPTRINKFGILKKNLDQGFAAVMCSKDNPDSPEFIKMFNEGLLRIKKQGKYKQILNTYGIEE